LPIHTNSAARDTSYGRSVASVRCPVNRGDYVFFGVPTKALISRDVRVANEATRRNFPRPPDWSTPTSKPGRRLRKGLFAHLPLAVTPVDGSRSTFTTIRIFSNLGGISTQCSRVDPLFFFLRTRNGIRALCLGHWRCGTVCRTALPPYGNRPPEAQRTYKAAFSP
jgi:hypothetical protein